MNFFTYLKLVVRLMKERTIENSFDMDKLQSKINIIYERLYYKDCGVFKKRTNFTLDFILHRVLQLFTCGMLGL